MKKCFLTFAVLTMATGLFTACSSDDDETPQKKAVDITNGIAVVCSGNMSSAINGGLTYYNYTTKLATVQAFRLVNGRELGLTANDALVYGSKMYIVVDNENTIEVVSKKDLKSVKQIKLPALMSNGQGAHPRHIIAKDGNIYVSNYGTSVADWSAYTTSGNGSVAVIDTLSFSLQKTYAVGAYPEGLAIVGDYLYVANSNYGMGNASISKVNLATGTESKMTDENIINPVSAVAIGGNLYYLDSGSYDYNPPYAQINAGVRKVTPEGQVTKVIDATAMCSDGKDIYVINSPYVYGQTPTTSYSVYSVASGSAKAFKPSSSLEFPNTIGVDPVTGDVFIAANSKDPDTGAASYTLPGYVKQFKADGTLVGEFACWTGPTAIVAITDVKYE